MRFWSLLVFFVGINLHVFSQQKTTQENAWEWLKANYYKFHVDTIHSDIFAVSYTNKSVLKYNQIIVYKDLKTSWSRLNKRLFTADIESHKTIRNASLNNAKAIIDLNGDTILIIPFNPSYDVISSLGNNFFVHRKFDSSANYRLSYVYSNTAELLPLPEDQEYKIFSDSFFIAISNKLNTNNRNNVGLYYLDGRNFIPVKYERIQLLSKGYYCCRSNEILIRTNRSESNKMDADIPVPSEQKEKTTFHSDLTADFCLIDSLGNIVPNSQKTINEKFDYRRTVEDEHQKYLDWVQETLKLELKIKYPRTNSHF
jgi:hypothetical protein